MADFVNMKKAGNSISYGKIFGVLAGILLVLIVIFNTFISVDSGHSGIVTTFGKVNEAVLPEGLHAKIPFVQQVVMMDNRVLKAEAQCTSASKDLQTVATTIALNYRVSPSSSANLYKNVGVDFQNTIVIPSIQDSVKAGTAKFTAGGLIADRQSVGEQMREAVAEKLDNYGLQVEIFNIVDFQFSDEFNAAIEAKQTAEQNALKAEQDLERIKVEAQQKIEQAKAEAEAYKRNNFV